MSHDLDFEEGSLLRERSESLKAGYTSYLQAHPEISQLLGDLVNSCLVHRPADVFSHAAEHFGGRAADKVEALLGLLRAFCAALRKEAADESSDMDALVKHVFYQYDADNNGTLETDEWLEFLSDFGEGHGLGFEGAQANDMHSWVCGVVEDGHMSAQQLLHAVAWLSDGEQGVFIPLEHEERPLSSRGPTPAANSLETAGGLPSALAPAAAAGAAAAAPRIIISGAPASGKGTQCEGIVETYGVKHISTGDLLRAAVKDGTELGLAAQGYMERGELVPDELLAPLVSDGLKGVTQGWLLDGFPRNKAQAEALRDAGVVPDVLIVLDVPDKLLTDRCVHRRVDPETGKIYHMVTSPPETEEIAARVIHRSDDTAEKIQTRLQLYHANEDAVCSVFADQVRRVSGEGDPKSIRAGIVEVIDTVTKAAPLLGVLVVGAPASGKGAQTERLGREYGLTRISTGSLLRAAIASGSDIGKAAKDCLDKGEPVPDHALVQLVATAIKSATTGWLLDGFPRSEAQARAMQEASVAPSVVILVDVPENVLVAKCTNRRIDRQTGAIYSIADLPEGVDASTLICRADDSEASVRARLATFEQEKNGVCGVFSDIVQAIDGNRGEEEIYVDVVAAIDSSSV